MPLYPQTYKSLLIFLTIIAFVNNIEQAKRITKFAIITVTLASFVGIMITKNYQPFLVLQKFLIGGTSPAELRTLSISSPGLYNAGLSANIHYFPYHLSLALFPCFYFLFFRGNRLFWCTSIIILFLAGFGSGQRSLIIAGIVGGSYLSFQFIREYFHLKRFLRYVVFACIIIILAQYFLPHTVLTRYTRIAREGGTIPRISLNKLGAVLFMDNPLGWGHMSFDTYVNYYRRVVGMYEYDVTGIHNNFMYPIVYAGLFGLFMEILFGGFVIHVVRKRVKITKEDRFFRMTIIASFLSLIVISMGHSTGFWMIGEGSVFLVLAIICSRGFDRSPHAQERSLPA